MSTNTSSLWPEIQRGMDQLHNAVLEQALEEGEEEAAITLTDMRDSNIKVTSFRAQVFVKLIFFIIVNDIV